MVTKCVVPNCGNACNAKLSVTLFSFPKDLKLVQKWVQATRAHYLKEIKSHHKVCSDHFEKQSILNHFGATRLAPGAIPTIFEWNRSSIGRGHRTAPILAIRNISDYSLSDNRIILPKSIAKGSTVPKVSLPPLDIRVPHLVSTKSGLNLIKSEPLMCDVILPRREKNHANQETNSVVQSPLADDTTQDLLLNSNMDTLMEGSYLLGDSELVEIRDNIILTLCTLNLDSENMNNQHLLKSLERLFLVVQDRLEELDGYKLEVSSLQNAYTSSRDKLNTSVQDHLRYEELWVEERASLLGDITGLKKKIRVLESRLVSQSDQNSYSNTLGFNDRVREEHSGSYVVAGTQTESEYDMEVICPPIHSHTRDQATQDDAHDDEEVVNELKGRIVSLRIQLEKMESRCEEEQEKWTHQQGVFAHREEQLLSRLREKEEHLTDVVVRNDLLRAELRCVKGELEDSQHGGFSFVPNGNSPQSEVSMVDFNGALPYSGDPKILGNEVEFFKIRLADNAHVIESVNKKYLELDQTLKDLKNNLATFTASISGSYVPSFVKPVPRVNLAQLRRRVVASASPSGKASPPKQKVAFIGDSYLRKIGADVSSLLPSKFETSTIRMNDAPLHVLAESLRQGDLPDFIVLSAGSIEVAYNELTSFKRTLLSLCGRINNISKIIICKAPFNYLLPPWSIVNAEIRRLNKFLLLLSRKFKFVRVIDLDFIDESMIVSKLSDPYFSSIGRQILSRKVKQAIVDGNSSTDAPIIPLPPIIHFPGDTI
ncbi:hypothetical protein GE061_001219 [Apolygus lucorum]|uniref:THAP-type domain-containing protein n=1 Tax=Apolygus lucorum TaxID=248454 RepID=A0A8S9Y818_APOLU|nr:hypothetical protein GE061_001219 [Apolygus lucorum]